jgi:subtilase family serine protease
MSNAKTHSLKDRIWVRAALALCLVLAIAGATTAFTRGSARAAVRPPVPSAQLPSLSTQASCTTASIGHAQCLSEVVTTAHGQPLTPADATAENLQPYGPHDLTSAYNLPSSTAGEGQTVAIVDAFDDPNAEADLAVYRSRYGLPPCTTDNGCFQKVAQDGSTNYPSPDPGWAGEISLDLDMVSAICPNCHILLVEANDNSFDNLGKSVNEAVALGANEVSNSYGALEADGENDNAAYYDHPGVVITASTGDSGYVVGVPAAFSTVVAVGGTSLFHYAGDPAWHESAWLGAGSGCSAYVRKPKFQYDRLCSTRTIADVSAVADPDTPVAVYDTYGLGGWVAFGGTSVASPIIASVYALAGNASTIQPLPYLYAHQGNLFDVTSGASYGNCAGSYLCTATRGYDGPTGLGTPNGTGAF